MTNESASEGWSAPLPGPLGAADDVDRPNAGSRAWDAGPADAVGRSLQDRLMFSHAQHLLVGLTGCRAADAARALVRTASEANLSAAAVARTLLNCVGGPADGHSEMFIAVLERAALANSNPGDTGTPPRPGRHQRGSSAAAVEPDWVVDGEHSPTLTAVPFRSGELQGIALRGALDRTTVDRLDAAVVESFPPVDAESLKHAGVFLFDLAGVTFLDNAGVAALRRAHAVVRDRQQTVRVIGPGEAGPRKSIATAVSRDRLDPVFSGTT